MGSKIFCFLKQQWVLFKELTVKPKFWMVLLADVAFLIISFFLAYYIRFEGVPNGQQYGSFISILPLLIFVKIIVFYLCGLYRGMWRYTSITDLFNILKGVLLSFLIIVIFLFYINRFEGLSRSVFIIDAILTFLFISGFRVLIRCCCHKFFGLNNLRSDPDVAPVRKRILLIGAGDASEKVIREVENNKNLLYKVVGLVDDDLTKVGKKIHGIPVVGSLDDLKEHAYSLQVDELLIAILTASGEEMKRIVRLCQETQLPFKVLPGLGEFLDGKVSLKSMRDISYGDLLGRSEVRLEQDRIGSYLADKVVLVTGAGGSIGSELCRQILRFSPKLMILFDAGEENLYSIQMELKHEHGFTDVIPILGKVQDIKLLNFVFEQYKPAVVFHAAAYKHVPLIENNPWQAVDNNIIASLCLIETSIVHNVERFVLVSTDKAVRPTNVMGASKRLTELLMLAYSKSKWDGSFCFFTTQPQGELSSHIPIKEKIEHNTIFMAVRFGNVLGSSGSVIPLFKKQIEKGGPVTVTHPEITRYFMSIEEAAQLILQAGVMGKGGEIFILEMGEPIKIVKMARDLIKLAGREPDSEIEIKFTGLREGEKLYEELITEGEGIVNTYHEKIMVLRSDNCPDRGSICQGVVQLKKKSMMYDDRAIKEILNQIIPEYKPDYSVCSSKSVDRKNN